MQNKKTETKTIDKQIKLLVRVLSRFPGFEIISSSVGYKKNESSSNQIPYSEFFVIFNFLDFFYPPFVHLQYIVTKIFN